MTIYFVDYKPCIATGDGFQPLAPYIYYEMLDKGEIDKVVEVNTHE